MSAVQPDEARERAAGDELDVLVVGAGFAGLYQLDRLCKLGFKVRVLRREPISAGSGARVDTYAGHGRGGTRHITTSRNGRTDRRLLVRHPPAPYHRPCQSCVRRRESSAPI